MPPHIGLSDAQRQGVIQMLTPLLSDEYVLYTKTHNYHWNVAGLQPGAGARKPAIGTLGCLPLHAQAIANLEMHGRGTFFDPRLDDAAQFPIDATARRRSLQCLLRPGPERAEITDLVAYLQAL